MSSNLGTSAPGKTPLINISNKGLSSEINFGTTVSQNDLNINYYSYNGSLAFSLSVLIAYLLRLPEKLRTDLRDLRPKS